MKCENCALSFNTFEMFCDHMVSVHNALKEKLNQDLHKHNCIYCDTNFSSLENLKTHYSTEHVYCKECNELLTDEDALHKHNLKEHVMAIPAEDIGNVTNTVKEEPEDLLTIKEEPIDCNDCGICDTCNTIHNVVMNIN